MKNIKLTSGIFFLIIISVIPFCFYLDHLQSVRIEEVYHDTDKRPHHEGLELFLPLIFGIYSLPFLIWTTIIYFKTNPDNIRKRIIELFAILLLAVLPAIGLNYFFYTFL